MKNRCHNSKTRVGLKGSNSIITTKLKNLYSEDKSKGVTLGSTLVGGLRSPLLSEIKIQNTKHLISCILEISSATICAFSASIYRENVFVYVKEFMIGFWGGLYWPVLITLAPITPVCYACGSNKSGRCRNLHLQ